MKDATETITTTGGTAVTSGTVTIGSVWAQPKPCPSCGYCPHCGRGGHHAIPFTSPYPTYPTWPYGTWITYTTV